MDKIIIRELALQAIIGTFPEERRKKQDVFFNLELWCDLAPAGQSDRLEDTVDYKAIKGQVIAMVENSEYFLVERLAQAVADVCLADKRVRKVKVTVDKPAALRFCRSVAVEIERQQPE